MEPGEKWPVKRDPLAARARPLLGQPRLERADRRHPGAGVPHGQRRREGRGARPARASACSAASSPARCAARSSRRPTPAALLLQLAARRLPHLPGLRPGDRHRPRARRPRSAADASPSARSRRGTRRPTRSSTTSCSKACRKRGVALNTPWASCAEDVREWIWNGSPEKSKRGARQFVNLVEFFKWLEQRTYKVHVRVLLARYRSYNPCPDCGGTRLRPEAVAVRLEGESLPELTAMSIEQLRAWLRERRWTPRQREVGRPSARRAGRARRGPPPGRPRLPDPGPPGAHALGRRDAAHPPRRGARLRPYQHALRARRADHRPPPAGQRAAARAAARPRRARQHRARGGARPHPDPRRRPRHRPGTGGRRARRRGRGRGPDRGDPGLRDFAHRALSPGAPADPGPPPRRPLPPRAALGDPGRGDLEALPQDLGPRRPRPQPQATSTSTFRSARWSR